MGNNNLNPKHFELVKPPADFYNNLQQIANYGYCTVVRHKLTLEEYQVYKVFTKQTRSLQQELNIYYFRNKQELNLVKTHFSIPLGESYFCTGNDQLTVYTEHIEIILKDIQNIPFPIFLYALRSSLRGYKAIFQQFGFININDTMMGVNYKKQFKVWMNSNFALNSRETDLYLDELEAESQQDQYIFVEKIFQVIEQHASNSNLLTDFKNKRNKTRMGFEQALHYITDFSNIYKIAIPNQFQTNPFDNQNNINQFLKSSQPKIQIFSKSIAMPKNVLYSLGQVKYNPINIQSNTLTVNSRKYMQNNLLNKTQVCRPNLKLPAYQSNNFSKTRHLLNNHSNHPINYHNNSGFSSYPTNTNISMLKRNRFNQQNHYSSNTDISGNALQIVHSSLHKEHIRAASGQFYKDFHHQSSIIERKGQKTTKSELNSLIEKPYFVLNQQIKQQENASTDYQKTNLHKSYNDDFNSSEYRPTFTKYKNLKSSMHILETDEIKRKEKVAQIIAEVKQSQQFKKELQKKQLLQKQLDFFKQNKLDYDKYKQLLKSTNQGELKQSITFEQLGNMAPTPKRQKDTPLLKLQKFVRRQISTSLSPEDQFLYSLSNNSQQSKNYSASKIQERPEDQNYI